ncbi:MAG TPA: flagellar motor protein MotB [Phycisphaerae bacterium]|jgi:chemotaxis protein MotB|nr:flagellar motor protein MotB [Phycisphaerae bacterium]
MAKKKAAAPEPAGESAPMWIVSFADLVTLMMSFFVVLYAMKQGGKQQQLETTAAIATQFGWTPPASDDSPLAEEARRRLGMPLIHQDAGYGQSANQDQGAEGQHPQVQTISDGHQIVTGGKITFDVGQTTITPDSLKTVQAIAKQIEGRTNVVIVKGHVSADEVALHPDDPNAMNLSYRRAVAVADELAKLGIDRRVLRPMPCGPFEPLLTGVYDSASLRQNRRVEVFTTDHTESEFLKPRTVPASTSSAPAAK